jgi:CDP-4-dehydro-6-deoxyglucose reductase
MLEDELRKGNVKKMHLVWGFRYARDIFYEKEFRALEASHPNFTCTITLSRPEVSWKGAKGRVTEWLTGQVKNPAEIEVYICGVSDMVTDAVTICEKIGLPKADIHFERYD